MYKINLIHPLFIASLFIILIGFNGCNKQDGNISSPEQNEFTQSDMQLGDFEDIMNNIVGPTLDKEMRFGDFPGQHMSNNPQQSQLFLGRIFRDLNLTRGQRTLAREFIDQNKECMRTAFGQLKDANEEILQNANEQRDQILERLRDGEITVEEAIELLNTLREEKREEIRNNPASIVAHEALCECKLSLLDDIRIILNEEQQAMWDEWVATLQGPCFEEG